MLIAFGQRQHALPERLKGIARLQGSHHHNKQEQSNALEALAFSLEQALNNHAGYAGTRTSMFLLVQHSYLKPLKVSVTHAATSPMQKSRTVSTGLQAVPVLQDTAAELSESVISDMMTYV